MGTPIRLSQQKAKSDSKLLRDLHYAAMEYNKYANHKILYIYRARQSGAIYKDYEVYFGKENFIHLVGFKKGKIGANDFYDKCLLGTLKLHEVQFKENRKAASAKLDAIQNLLDYRHCKIYKMNEADIITQKNKFEVGLGNNAGIMGFDKRIAGASLPIPVTVMKRPITDYVSNPENVVAIFMKEKNGDFYDTVIGCVSSGILKADLPKSIQAKISEKVPSKILKI